jgi:hypothetical protein
MWDDTPRAIGGWVRAERVVQSGTGGRASRRALPFLERSASQRAAGGSRVEVASRRIPLEEWRLFMAPAGTARELAPARGRLA